MTVFFRAATPLANYREPREIRALSLAEKRHRVKAGLQKDLTAQTLSRGGRSELPLRVRSANFSQSRPRPVRNQVRKFKLTHS
jgi:hypothetical protein